jgi:type I restriction enzyme, R subunit
MPNEADTCRKFVVPKLQAAGWDNEPHSIAEQRIFTDGRIVVRGKQAERRKHKCASPDELRARWADAGQRADILQQLASPRGITQPTRRRRQPVRFIPQGERGIDFPQVAAQAGQPDADCAKAQGQRLNAKGNCSRLVSAFSLQHSAFPHSPRRQRAGRVKRQELAFFNYFKPEAKEILSELLEKYAADGELQFVLPDVLKLPPISRHGTAMEIAKVFGGTDELRTAVNRLQTLLYAE